VALRRGRLARRAVSEGSGIRRGLPGHSAALPLEARKRVGLPPSAESLESRLSAARNLPRECVSARVNGQHYGTVRRSTTHVFIPRKRFRVRLAEVYRLDRGTSPVPSEAPAPSGTGVALSAAAEERVRDMFVSRVRQWRGRAVRHGLEDEGHHPRARRRREPRRRTRLDPQFVEIRRRRTKT
jgi:hypothetical protein